MNKTNISINFSDISQRTEKQSEQIRAVLSHLKPIQTKLLGEKTVKAISQGATFESIEGGRHLNFTEVLSLLSDIASLTQVAILIIMSLAIKIRASGEPNAESSEEVAEIATTNELKEDIKRLISENISAHPDLKKLNDLIIKDSAILDKIVEKLMSDTDKANKTMMQ